jgi:hypothetical protein
MPVSSQSYDSQFFMSVFKHTLYLCAFFVLCWYACVSVKYTVATGEVTK